MADSCLVEYPALGRTVLRPTRYRRVNKDDPQPWQLALVRLWDRKYTDDRIADALSNLSASAISRLEQAGTWGWRAVEGACMDQAGGRVFTRQQIKRHRKTLGLRGHRGICELGSIRNLRAAKDREYQRQYRWEHLLPVWVSPNSITGRPGHYLPGYELKRRETDILTALRDIGPMSRRQLCRTVGAGSLNTKGRSYLVRLQMAGLVRCEWDGRRDGMYRLAGRALEKSPRLLSQECTI